MNKERPRPGALLPLILSLAFLQPSLAQDAATDAANDVDDEQVERLERRKKEAELRADIKVAEKRAAEAVAATAKASAGKTKPLEGTVSLNTGAGYFSEILAYRSLQAAATTIAMDVASVVLNAEKKIVVMDKPDIAAEIAMWQLTISQINRLKERQAQFLVKFAEDEPVEAAGFVSAIGLTSAISSVADLIGYFREDISLTKYEVTLNDQALVALVVAELKRLAPLRVIVNPTKNINNDGPLISAISELGNQRSLLLERLQKIQETDSESDYAKLAKTEIESVTNAVAELIEKLTTAPKDDALSPLESLAVVDTLRSYSDDMFLYLSIAGQGGEVQITKSIWTGGRISYIGGSTCVYFLTDASGVLYASGAPSNYLKAWYGQRSGVSKLRIE